MGWNGSQMWKSDHCADNTFGFHAAVLRMRSDWAFNKAASIFPHWVAKKCCWNCHARNSPGELGDFRDATANDPWRNNRISMYDFMGLQMAQRIAPSTLCSCPGVTVNMVMVDRLHTMDKGVKSYVIGNVLWDALPFAAPSPRQEQFNALRSMLQLYYKDARVPDRQRK